MLRKTQVQNNYSTTNRESSDENQSDILQSHKNSFLNLVIGSMNVKRWDELKNAFSCKTNEIFVTKLLDIAQDYLHKNSKHDHENKKPHKAKNKTGNQKTTSNKIDKNLADNKNTSNVKQSDKLVENIVEESNDTDLSRLKDAANSNKQNVYKHSNSTIERQEKGRLDDAKTDARSENKISSDVKQETNGNSKSSKDSKVTICRNCSTQHNEEGGCPIETPHYIVNDSLTAASWAEKYKFIHDENLKLEKFEDNHGEKAYSYSRMSLPKCLTFEDTQSQHGLGVFATKEIHSYTQFGPLVGTVVKEVDIPDDSGMRDIWEIQCEGNNVYVSTENVESSNWLKYIQPAPWRDKRNITAICKENQLYFVSMCTIKPGEELLYWQDGAVATTKKKMEKTVCGGCNMTFAHPIYYRTHCSVFHDLRYSLTIRKFHCKICGAAVLGKENIMKHATEQHNGQGAYQCQFCKKFFLRLNYLEMHRTYGCSANPHRSWPLCDFCGRKFCQPQKLKVHIKRMHSDISEVLKEFQCKNCMRILGSRAALQRHVKEVHERQVDETCSCSMCGKHFQNKSNLKIHMLTHSGIKPFKCKEGSCNAAFTTKQCLQFHYKKVHNYTEDNMPRIERSVDYTFQGYSGKSSRKGNEETDCRNNEVNEFDDESLDSKSVDDPPALQSPLEMPEVLSPTSHIPENTSPVPEENFNNSISNVKIVSKGSKKWIAEDHLQPVKNSDIYSIERLSKESIPTVSIHENDLYDRNKISSINDFSRHEASNASLLVEAALDSVCSEPNIDIDVSTSTNCTISLVNNLYTLSQPDNLPEVSYSDTACIAESRDISLMSPNQQISVTDELSEDLRHNPNINIDYAHFNQDGFSPSVSPNEQRTSFVKNYTNHLSPQNGCNGKNSSPVPSPPRYDFGHNVNTDHMSSDESNGMAAQNLSLNSNKNDIQLDLSIYKSPYKLDYIRRFKFEGENNLLEQDVDNINHALSSSIQTSQSEENKESDNRSKYHDDISSEIRNKFEFDLELRLKNYETTDDVIRQRLGMYDSDLDFRSKTNYDLIDTIENRNKSYDAPESEFRNDRNFEPLALNSSELQGLDMSARSFHNYSNINRYHHLYPDVDRVDLRLNYSPPPPPYTHDLLRVVSLDLTPPGRHSVDLSLRTLPLHQIANTRLLTDHNLQNNHRLLDQGRLLSTDLTATRLSESRLLPDPSGRILSDHSTNRILGNNDNLLPTEQSRLLGEDSRILPEQPRLLDQGRLISDSRILPAATPSGAVSPVPFTGYSVNQSPYHPTPIAPRPHVTSPTSFHHYSYY